MTDSKHAQKRVKALEGSFEELQERIREAALDLDLFPGATWVWVRATFPDRAVIDVDVEGEADRQYEVPWSEEEGVIQLGEPTEVEIVETVQPKEGEPGAATKRAAAPEQTKGVAPFQLKELKDAPDGVGGWEASGVFSVFGVVDFDGDRVQKGAFARSLAERLPKVKDHHGVTVGQATKATETDIGLEIDFRIYPTSAGKDLAVLMQQVPTEKGPAAPVEQGSIGFSVAPGGAKRNDDGTTDLVELDLWEVSPVTFGANEFTRIGLKELREMRALDGPLDQYLTELATTMTVAAREAKALYIRRKAEDRELSARHIDAMADYAEAAGAAVVDLEGLLAKAAVRSTTRLRYIAALIDRLQALVDGPQEPAAPAPTTEDDEPAAKAASGDDGAQAEPTTEVKGEDASSRSKDLEALWLKHAMRLYGVTHHG